MSENVTDADRETAEDLTRELWLMTVDADVVAVHGEQAAVHAVMDGHADHIATALAAEREKARAPFLALAEELEAWATENDSMEPTSMDGLLRSITAGRVTRRIAQEIRRAAEEQQ